MKIQINMKKTEVNAVKNADKAWIEAGLQSTESLVPVKEASKGFSVSGFLTNKGSYQYEVEVPEWVICEGSRLAVKYLPKVQSLVIILKQLELLCEDWFADFKKEVRDIKHKYMC